MGMHDEAFAGAVETLRKTVREGRTFDAAQIHIIGLDDVRAEAGQRWERMKARVRAYSHDFLLRRLGRDDVILPCGDGFLIIFGDGEPRDLTKQCDQIRNALNALYLGEEGMARLRAEVVQRKLDATQVAALVPKPAPIKPQRVIGFAPVWSVARELITTYFATPIYRDRSGAVRHGYEPLYRAAGRQGEGDFLALDLEILERCHEAVVQCLDRGRPCAVGYSVHATTLQRRTRRAAYRDRLLRLDPRARRYLIGRIAEIERGAPQATLAEWIALLNGASARVALELHIGEYALEGLRCAGAWAVGFHQPTAAGQGAAPPTARYPAIMARWRAALHRQGLRFYVGDVMDKKMLEAVGAAGAAFITSERFWPSLASPAGICAAEARGEPAFFAADAEQLKAGAA